MKSDQMPLEEVTRLASGRKLPAGEEARRLAKEEGKQLARDEEEKLTRNEVEREEAERMAKRKD